MLLHPPGPSRDGATPDHAGLAGGPAPRPVEAVMVAEGALIRIGPQAEDVLPVEDLSLGDAIWDMQAWRLVDLETLACATFGPRELAEQGLRALHLGPRSTIAIASPRLRGTPDDRQDPADPPRVFFRLWPETRTHVLIDQTECLISPAKWG